MSCHPHKKGFDQDCGACHGYPPVDSATLVFDPSPTGSATAGAHSAHTAKSVACSNCHYMSVGTGTTHRDSSVTLGFYAFDGGYQGGTYGGQTTVTSYNDATTTPVTIINKNDSKQCSNIYCHGVTMEPNGGTNIIPVWDEPATGACGTCHGATAANPPVKGGHQKHAGNISTVISAVPCSTCHTDNGHVNKVIEWKFSPETRVSGAAYKGASTGSETMGTFPKTYGQCTNLYCHSNASPAPNTDPSDPNFAFKNEANEYKTVTWGESIAMGCDSCHRGRVSDSLGMKSNGHYKLAGKDWIRKYPCTYCHNATVDASGNISDVTKHINGTKDVVMSNDWAILGRGNPTYNKDTKVCSNVYCHSDGTTDPEDVRPFGWTVGRTECNTCHGHPNGSCSNEGCHDGRTDANGNVWTIKTGWPSGEEWKAAMPMFTNQGPGTARSNSHSRHMQTDFQCDVCHFATIKNGTCTDCHVSGIPAGNMSEVSHIDPAYHVNKIMDIVFRDGGTYNPDKTCSNTVCHTGGADPQWGSSVEVVICLSCHGTTTGDVDDFGSFNGAKAKINTTEWATVGHGRPTSAGNYPSGNPPANFPGNPCWYCHDNTVLHKDSSNPFRLRKHTQFERRFEKECVYCHMEGLDSECLGCHNSAESLAPQLNSQAVMDKHSGNVYTSGCRVANCHATDAMTHNTDAGLWSSALKSDVKNQYVMMGVCLKCHEDDSNGTCIKCHVGPQYTIGFDPGTGFIKPQQARANSVHYGYKHFAQGTKKGGKFCWDCHDPHGDSNICMIQKKVATSSDGLYGKPETRADVTFTKRVSGLDYAKISAPYNGICNVCHTYGSQHYRNDYGDGHNSGRVCTACHEHRFNNSHASGQDCETCHGAKPVPSHTAFGLPRDCTKCHSGLLGQRMDIMGQFNSNSHHVQGTDISNKNCYVCHWEATEFGLINTEYHQGYNYKTHTSVKNAQVDLVILGPNSRPTTYQEGVTVSTFLASNMGTGNERSEVAKITPHCLSCHSDQNNDYQPFDDCKTPRQYAWDRKSIDARYSQTDTATWGKYTSFANASKKNITKAYSAHGNAQNNFGGGWDMTLNGTGNDGTLNPTRGGAAAKSIECFDCHNSHGSKAGGITSSYVTFNGTKNGGNLKETQAGKGGYSMTYRATAKTNGINPYNEGAAQCFDCHESASAGTTTNASPEYKTPWGYQETFGATAAVKGYMDTPRFGAGTKGLNSRTAYKKAVTDSDTNMGGHLRRSSTELDHAPEGSINGLCTSCHDPHGISPTLGSSDQPYAVPLLKGTWLTSPYKEDLPIDGATSGSMGTPGYDDVSGIPYYNVTPFVNTDQKTFGTGNWISEDDTKFAGLCLRCHPKTYLTDETSNNGTWKGRDRVHESVKGWGDNQMHAYSCSKCHQPHVSALPRLMQTNCLDSNHRGRVPSGGVAGSGSGQGWEGSGSGSFPKGAGYYGSNCHPTGTWPDNDWNDVTPW